MAISWSATPLVVSPGDESVDGREEEDELRKEQESEVANDVGEHNDSAIEDVHEASKKKDAAAANKKDEEGNKSLFSEESKVSAIEVIPEAAKETEPADSERKEEEGTKTSYACKPKDSVENALHRTAKETEAAHQTAKVTEAADSKREEVRNKVVEDAKDTQEQEHSAIEADAAKAGVAVTEVHLSFSRKVSERKKKHQVTLKKKRRGRFNLCQTSRQLSLGLVIILLQIFVIELDQIVLYHVIRVQVP